jgi:hypothetical protein
LFRMISISKVPFVSILPNIVSKTSVFCLWHVKLTFSLRKVISNS